MKTLNKVAWLDFNQAIIPGTIAWFNFKTIVLKVLHFYQLKVPAWFHFKSLLAITWFPVNIGLNYCIFDCQNTLLHG